MIAIGDVISKILCTSSDWKIYLITHWHHIVGSLASRMRIEKIDHDTLVISTCDSVWLHELSALSDILLHKINQELPSPAIKTIRFTCAGKKYQSGKKIIAKLAPAPYQRPISDREQHALRSIKDKDLSNALYQFLVRCQNTPTH